MWRWNCPVVRGGRLGQDGRVKLVDVQQVGNELAIKWADGTESFIPLEKLRRACPCAGCKGEMDVLGNLYKGPDIALRPESFRLRRITPVGTYALQPSWEDGHNSGIYSYDYLARVADA
ncbi:MAG TPA: DUF971 domain-containing protein [Verrucomicrobiae bacterium]|nr:DUF971 domain-containing protein [Verrucomicrobiae bacterium]